MLFVFLRERIPLMEGELGQKEREEEAGRFVGLFPHEGETWPIGLGKRSKQQEAGKKRSSSTIKSHEGLSMDQ